MSDSNFISDSAGFDPKPQGTPQVLTVEQLNRQIRQLIESGIGVVWLQGEISNFKAHTSGHFYFSLKDSKSQITAVMFRGSNSRLRFKPHDGLEVLVRAKVTVYEPRGNYQIVCESMEPVGAGALQKAFEQLKEKLKAEGLFDSARKKSLPEFPKHLAVVTSPTGAAIRDILNVLKRRNSAVEVTLVPTVVQGEAAAIHIREALKSVQKLKDVDVVILARGGGSIEDMWCFNDEPLARQIAEFDIPIITGIGHEIDFTIADFVADVRAPTPSAAAELVVKNASEVQEKVRSLGRLLTQAIQKILKFEAGRFQVLRSKLVDPRRKLQDMLIRQDELSMRLQQSAQNMILRKRSELAAMARVLDSLSPLRVLDRGYSVVLKQGRAITKRTQLKPSDEIEIRFADGSARAEIVDI